MTPTPSGSCLLEVQPILLSAPLIIKLNHFCWVGHDVIVIFAMFDENVEHSLIPIGEDSHTNENVPRGFFIESNCMCFSPLMRGRADTKWKRSSTAGPMPTLSPIGIGPRGGMDDIFLNS